MAVKKKKKKKNQSEGSLRQALVLLALFAGLLTLTLWAVNLGPGGGSSGDGDDEAPQLAADRAVRVAPGGDERRRAVDAAEATKPGDLMRATNARLLEKLTEGLPPAPPGAYGAPPADGVDSK